MKMKRLLITLTVAMCVAGSLWAKDDEVIVTRQLTMAQRKSLPEKTITVETKRLAFNKKADVSLMDAISHVMDTIAKEDYLNRTFVMLIEPRPNGEIGIAARNDDIVTRGRDAESNYFGTFELNRHHFVVLLGKDNQELLERTFKRQSKVTFIQEFEFVEFKTPILPTNVIGCWHPDSGLRMLTVIINEDPNEDSSSFDAPARLQK